MNVFRALFSSATRSSATMADARAKAQQLIDENPVGEFTSVLALPASCSMRKTLAWSKKS
jgi:hypothetical protein